MGPDKSDKNGHEKGKISPFWDKFVMQAMSLANDATHSPVGKMVKEQVEQIVVETRPQVEKVVKEYTKEIGNPYQLGMGLEILRMSDEKVEAVMPHRWRNRNAAGSVHNSALSALAEFASKAYWEKQTEDLAAKMTLVEIQGKFFETSYRQVKAVMEIPGELREEKISLLKNKGIVTVPMTVLLKKRGDAKVAEFTLLWQLETDYRIRSVEAEVEVEGETEVVN